LVQKGYMTPKPADFKGLLCVLDDGASGSEPNPPVDRSRVKRAVKWFRQANPYFARFLTWAEKLTSFAPGGDPLPYVGDKLVHCEPVLQDESKSTTDPHDQLGEQPASDASAPTISTPLSNPSKLVRPESFAAVTHNHSFDGGDAVMGVAVLRRPPSLPPASSKDKLHWDEAVDAATNHIITAKNKSFEYLVYPTIYTEGWGAWSPPAPGERADSVSFGRDAKIKLNHWLPLWRANRSWPFFASDQKIRITINTYNHKFLEKTKVSEGHAVRAKELLTPRHTFLPDEAKDQRDYDENRTTAIPSSVPWSRASSSKRFKELVSMAQHLGNPDQFWTLTGNESTRSFVENLKAISESLGTSDGKPNRNEEAFWHSNHFAHRFETLKRQLMKDLGIVGQVKHFWWRYEDQKRHFPHVHMIIWLEHPETSADMICAHVPERPAGYDGLSYSLALVRSLAICVCAYVCMSLCLYK
jgi:hypothetical protein